MLSKIPELNGEIGATVITDGKEYDHFYHFKEKKEYPDTLTSFIYDAGVPYTLVTDEASEIQKGCGRQIANKYQIDLKLPHFPWQTLAKAAVKEKEQICEM